MLSQKFDDLLVQIGNPALEHPIFYHAPVGIRFEIGCDSPVYLDDMAVNPRYVASALARAQAIYEALPHKPDLLRIDTYPQEDEPDCGAFHALLSRQQEQRTRQIKMADDGGYPVLHHYWELTTMAFSPEPLLREIILADLGGSSALVSSVYFANTADGYLFHLYDDRGADLVARDKELLRPLYRNFHRWVLDYDRARMDTLFAT